MLVQRCHNSAHLLVAQDLTINAEGYLDLTEGGCQIICLRAKA